MIACDLCGAPVGQYDTRGLHKWLQIDGVAQLCPACFRDFDAWHIAERAAAHAQIEARFRERLRQRKGMPEPLPPLPMLPWWRRLPW
jgi:hypothetical protein